jgi:putative MATE family efflux protein
MEQENLRKNLRKLAIPIFFETLLVMMLGAVDTIMLSRYSDNSVAAVGMVNQLINLAFLLFQVSALGTSILCSQYIGAKEPKKVVQVVGISIMLNAFIGIVISMLIFFFSKEILQLMGLRPELMPDGVKFMRIVGFFAFFQAISMSLSASLRSANKAIYPMMVIVVVNVLNIIGNYVLIFGKFGCPSLGAEGSAIATSISRGVSMLLLFYFLFRKHIPKFPIAYFRPFPFKELKKLIKIGIPSAGEQVSYSLSQVVITYFINYISNEALAARTYCTNIIMFTYLLTISVGQAGAICVGHLIGKKKTRAAFVLGKYGMKLSILFSVLFSTLLALSGKFVFPWLTQNPEIIQMGVTILWIDVILELGRALNIFGVNALRSTGDIYFPFIIGLTVMWTISVGGSYFFGIHMGWGLAGMWFAFLLDENIRGVIFVHRWFGRKWTKKSFV